MIRVTVNHDKLIENALQRIKKKWLKAVTLRKIRSRIYYLKSSEGLANWSTEATENSL